MSVVIVFTLWPHDGSPAMVSTRGFTGVSSGFLLWSTTYMKFYALAVLGTALCSAGAWAQQPAPEPAAADAMMAGIDARTGKLRRLTDTEIAQLSAKAQSEAAAAARSGQRANAAWAAIPLTGAEAEKTLRVLPNGMSVASLPLSAMHSMSAQLNADGTLLITESDAHPVAAQEVSE